MDSIQPTHRGHALRSGRISESGRIYLLTTVTANRQPIFQELRPARILIQELRRLHEQQAVDSLAWVVMPDHLHWLLQLRDRALPETMQQLKSRSAILINRVRGTDGLRVWQRGFHDRALRRDEDLTAAARYIVANPLRAGLARRLADYPHWDAIWL